MTRHNLSRHLAWLLGSQSNIPASPPVIHPSASSTVTLGAEPFSLSQFPYQTGEGIRLNESLNSSTNGSGPATSEEFARPSLPASALPTQSSGTMGRLQSGSKSSTKPRLLSAALPELAQTPKQPSLSRSVTSLGDQYNAAYSRGNASE